MFHDLFQYDSEVHGDYTKYIHHSLINVLEHGKWLGGGEGSGVCTKIRFLSVNRGNFKCETNQRNVVFSSRHVAVTRQNQSSMTSY